MNHLLPLLLLFFALSPMAAEAQNDESSSREGSGLQLHDAAFEEFVALQGWIFTPDLAKADGLMDLEGAAPRQEGGVSFSARDFDPRQFDPRNFVISQNVNPQRPTNFRVGDRGVIQFHSVERCKELYQRQLTLESKRH